MSYPGVEFVLDDRSPISQNTLGGVTGILVPAERGPLNEPVLVTNWAQYRKTFGELHLDSPGPMYINRFLAAGGVAKVIRIAHYSTGPSGTVDGSVATGEFYEIQSPAVPEILASAEIIFTGVAGQLNGLEINGVDIIGGAFTPVTFTTMPIFLNGVINSISLQTSTPEYTVAVNNTNNGLVITALAGTGASVNGFAVVVNTSGGLTATQPTMSGGITAQPEVLSYTRFEAKNIGAWANTDVQAPSGLQLTVKTPKSGLAGFVDIRVSLLDHEEFSFDYFDLPEHPTSIDIAIFNQKCPLVNITDVNATFAVNTVTFLGGAQNYGSIDEDDYTGNGVSSGLYAMNGDTDIVRFIAPCTNSHVYALAAVAYAESHGLRTYLGLPVETEASEWIDYRDGISPAYIAINSYYASLVGGGGIKIVDPLTKLPFWVSEVADVAGRASFRDQKFGPWFAVGRAITGKLPNVLDVYYDLNDPERAAEAEIVASRGLILVVKEQGARIFSNRTLDKSGKATKFEHVAELVLHIERAMRPILKSFALEPNLPETWRRIYQSGHNFFLGLEAGQAVQKLAKNYWQGDQDVDDVNNCVINNPADVLQGKYKLVVSFQPVGAIESITMTLGLDGGVLVQ